MQRSIMHLLCICLGFALLTYDGPLKANGEIITPYIETSKAKNYAPGSEELAADEMRVIALGTGTPHVRPNQAAAGWLVELGNGEKFIFDLGINSIRNLSALSIPYDHVSKVFLSHLHVDHIGDVGALWLGGWTNGRVKNLEVWGPSGIKPEHGTAHFISNLKEAYAWDYETRSGKLPVSGGQLIAHEFDFTKEQVVFNSNGVKITSFPETHILDGAVGYRLDWNGLSFVYSGDTTPNKWFAKHGKNADIVVQEVYMTVSQLKGFGWSEELAEKIATVVHTKPDDAGKIFEMIKPRLAVAYHLYNDFDIVFDVEKEIRSYYDGPLVFAQDLMTFNITRNEIHVRLASIPNIIWTPVADSEHFSNAKRAKAAPMSDWLKEGRLFLKKE